MLAITESKGFQMKFENGWTISVQFGYGNYCENKNHPDRYHVERNTEIFKSPDAEIAIWGENGKWYDFGTGIYKGWCSANEVAEWIDKVSKF